MAKGAGATQEKRRRERQRKEAKEIKNSERAVRKEEKKLKGDGPEGEDPDLAGIVAGPQPIIED
ncbi:MAG: hypothetical protein H7333_08815 [Bdellovibrionales bacterium]|nr:hypothetical protein [Oligoflexia bacterium]